MALVPQKRKVCGAHDRASKELLRAALRFARVPLDECVHAGVTTAFPGHTVKTVMEIEQCGSPDGPLLTFAQERFDVFVTIDRNLEDENNLRKFKLGFVIVRVVNNEIASYQPLFAKLKEAAQKVRAGEVVYAVIPPART
ncbi:MAG: hypothetical protein ABI165_04580 [Bryobacteraceae bacterium]